VDDGRHRCVQSGDQLHGCSQQWDCARSSICSNAYAATLTKYGFTPVTSATTDELHKPGYVKGKSYCGEL
jgi:hypothetical protein